MGTDLYDLRDTLRQKLRDAFQSCAMADWVLALVMPEVRQAVRSDREKLARLADELGAGELAAAIRSGKPVGPAGVEPESAFWNCRLPFAEA